jgi:hypothetical protein
MCEMYDGDGSQIRRYFNTKMIKLGGRYDNAAAPLHYAIKQMRNVVRDQNVGQCSFTLVLEDRHAVGEW